MLRGPLAARPLASGKGRELPHVPLRVSTHPLVTWFGNDTEKIGLSRSLSLDWSRTYPSLHLSSRSAPTGLDPINRYQLPALVAERHSVRPQGLAPIPPAQILCGSPSVWFGYKRDLCRHQKIELSPMCLHGMAPPKHGVDMWKRFPGMLAVQRWINGNTSPVSLLVGCLVRHGC